jgi:hypothetical protein
MQGITTLVLYVDGSGTLLFPHATALSTTHNTIHMLLLAS